MGWLLRVAGLVGGLLLAGCSDSAVPGATAPCAGRGGDTDGDDVCQVTDNCPDDPNPNQRDADDDGSGDVCDATPLPCDDRGGDEDGDTICGDFDNCRVEKNFTQADRDADGIGDACDAREDGGQGGQGGGGEPSEGGQGGELGEGGEPTPLGACAGLGGDADGDDWCGVYDNCPGVPNGDQADSNADGRGDACSVEVCNGLDDNGDQAIDEGFPDQDEDGAADCVDRCRDDRDTDGDADGVPDCLDLCPDDPLNDPDLDQVCHEVDNCWNVANLDQADRDDDGIGDACDIESCDGINNDADSFVDEGMPDADKDSRCDAIDACPNDALNDADQDGLCADVDNCAAVANPEQGDSDGDDLGDACDLDSAVACGPSAPLNAVGAVPLPAGVTPAFMAVDPTRDVVYITVGNVLGGKYANELVAIDAASQSVLWSVLLGSGPKVIAVADDGSRAYVGVDALGAVSVVDLVKRSACFQFVLGHDRYGGPRYVNDMVALPGQPDVVVLSANLQGSTAFGGTFVYDSGVARPEYVQADAYLLAATAPDVVYGYNNRSTAFGLRKLEIDAQGIREVWAQADLFSGFFNDLLFAGGLMYATTGVVVDPVFPKITGKFASSGPIAVDPVRKEAYIVAATNRIDVFDTTTYLLKRQLTVTTGSASQLERWGDTGLVIRHGTGLTFTTLE